MDETSVEQTSESADQTAPSTAGEGADGAATEQSGEAAPEQVQGQDTVGTVMETDTAATTTASEGELGPDPLANLEDDKGAFVLGALPLILIAVFGLGCVAVFFVRRKKNWNDLDDALKIDGGDTPIDGDEAFTTRDLQEMEPTKPSQRMSDLGD